MTCDRCGHLEGEHLEPLPLAEGATLNKRWFSKPCFKPLDDQTCNCEDYL